MYSESLRDVHVCATQCASGSYSGSGATACTACGAGKYLTSASAASEADACATVRVPVAALGLLFAVHAVDSVYIYARTNTYTNKCIVCFYIYIYTYIYMYICIYIHLYIY